MRDGRLVMIDWQGRWRPRRDVILELQEAGVPVADIARRLGVRYQIVYMTLKGAPRPASDLTVRPVAGGATQPMDAVLLGCVKTKDVRPRPARDLYVSPLFKKRRQYAESSGHPWWIVSAEYGLVGPDEMIAPYDTLIGKRPLAERQVIARQVADRLEHELGSLRGKRLELHAGTEYAEAIGPELRARGAELIRPLEGLVFGEQLAWYGAPVGSASSRPPRPPGMRPSRGARPLPADALGDGRGLGRRLSELFMAGRLDLSARPGAPSPGWEGMPEVVAVHRLRAMGATGEAVRRFLTFWAAMERARDADRVAVAAVRLYADHPWAFDPQAIVQRPLRALADELRRYGVSQRHVIDAFGWRVLAETLADPALAPAARAAIYSGEADARALLAELGRTTDSGTPLFPLLGGPKVGPLWVRLLAYPGGARIRSLEVVPVAVDAQVRKVTEYLGVTDTAGRHIDDVRDVIQRTWAEDVVVHGAAGPDGLRDTPGALDPALWFYAKWGCTFCQRANRQLPISPLCSECRFGPE